MSLSLTEVASFISSVGFPIALVLLLGLAVWRIGKPLLEKLVASHIAFLDSLGSNVTEIRQLYSEQNGRIGHIDEGVTDIRERIDRIEDRLSRSHGRRETT